MCGIAGKISTHPIKKEDIKKMTDLMIRRGPDAEGIDIFRDNELYIGFGQRRLKIIDLSDSANQPFFSNDKKIILLFNGEIYNFQELRLQYCPGENFRTKSDTEVILKLYEKLGIACVEKFRGMFAIAIYDLRHSVCYLARDHVGKKPLFYTQTDKEFIFASRLKPLLTQLDQKPKLNLTALADYLDFGYVPTNHCIYENIYKLPPATILEYKNGQTRLLKYWQLQYEPKLSFDLNKSICIAEEILAEAIKLRLIADVPLGAFLSGGIDSSLIVALMSKLQGKVKTFSIGFDQEDFNELKYARQIANKFATEHTEFIVTPSATEIIPELIDAYDEPIADPSMIPMHYLTKLTRQKVTVALNGDGGDEAFAGYERYLGFLYQQKIQFIPKTLRKIFLKLIENIPENSAHTSLIRRLKWLLRGSLHSPAESYLYSNLLFLPEQKKLLIKDFTTKGKEEFLNYFSKTQDIIDKMLETDFNTYLPEDLLVKADRASMHHSLEARSPFLDVKLLEFTARLPTQYKIKKGQLKFLLKKIAEKHLPKEIIYRKKQGFGVPLGSWFKGDLANYLKDSLTNSQLAKQNILSQSGIDQLICEHLSGQVNHGRRLFALLMLESWFARS